MNDKNKKLYIKRYSERLKKFGYSPKTLGWGEFGRQEIRFSVLAEMPLKNPGSSVLDVGCGFGDLFGYLKENGWHGNYHGIDIVPSLIEEGQKKYTGINLELMDITSNAHKQLPEYDYVISSGVFNAKLIDEKNYDHIEIGLTNMFKHSQIAICCDFLSSYVDFQHPEGWHTDPAIAFQIAKKISKRILVRHDYMPYEFALFIFNDDNINENNIFSSFTSSKK